MLRFLCATESFENTIKSAGDLEKVGNRIVAIVSINTCSLKLHLRKIVFIEHNC